MRAFLILFCLIFFAASAYSQTGVPTEISVQSTIADKNQQAANAFLAANAKKSGVMTLPNGLQYQIIKNGTGPIPAESNVVVVDYAGALIDGTEFDSSYKRGQPASFPVSAVIPGWTQALQMMKEGSTWMLYIPPALAYGEQGAPPVIGPNEALIFKVHLIKVNK